LILAKKKGQRRKIISGKEPYENNPTFAV